MKKFVCIVALLAASACAPKPMGLLREGALTPDTRLVFGKITLAENRNNDTHMQLCLIDGTNDEKCGKLESPSAYLRYDSEKPYYDYVSMALPPGRTKISSILVANTTYQLTSGLEFMVDASQPATYFGDVVLYVADGNDGADEQGRQSVTYDNGAATFAHLRSINPHFPAVASYGFSPASPLLKYKEVQRVRSGGTIIFLPTPR